MDGPLRWALHFPWHGQQQGRVTVVGPIGKSTHGVHRAAVQAANVTAIPAGQRMPAVVAETITARRTVGELTAVLVEDQVPAGPIAQQVEPFIEEHPAAPADRAAAAHPRRTPTVRRRCEHDQRAIHLRRTIPSLAAVPAHSIPMLPWAPGDGVRGLGQSDIPAVRPPDATPAT